MSSMMAKNCCAMSMSFRIRLMKDMNIAGEIESPIGILSYRYVGEPKYGVMPVYCCEEVSSFRL